MKLILNKLQDNNKLIVVFNISFVYNLKKKHINFNKREQNCMSLLFIMK